MTEVRTVSISKPAINVKTIVFVSGNKIYKIREITNTKGKAKTVDSIAINKNKNKTRMLLGFIRR